MSTNQSSPVVFTLEPATDFGEYEFTQSDKNNNNEYNSSQDPITKNLPSKLTLKTKFFYSLGHVYNDLTVSIWFSYTLLFFQFQFSGVLAGALILIGQIADAIASPFVGMQSDNSANFWLCRKFGRRKTWHMLGVIMNTISVPLVYNECFTCQKSSQWVRFAYFSVLIIIFQAGWAATQVSHVSLITDLTADIVERIELNSYRQAATIGANICLYAVTLFVIGFGDNDTLTEKDLVIFTKVAYIVCGIGLVFAILFHVFVHEPEVPVKPRKVKSALYRKETKKYLQHSRGSMGIITLLANNKDEATPDYPTPSMSSLNYEKNPEEFERKLKEKKNSEKLWYHWFQSFSFWKITSMYTFARMLNNVTQVYTTLYLQRYLLLPKRMIAIIPFATYVSGFVFSFVAKPLSARFGSRLTLVLGCVFGVVTGVCIFIGQEHSIYKTYLVYIVFAFLGISGTAQLISSLSMTSDLIGCNTATGAFVFASMSFFDKSVNGVVIALLEQFKPPEKTRTPVNTNNTTSSHIDVKHEETYYMYIMIFLTIIPSALIGLGLMTIVKTRYGRRSPSTNSLPSMTGH